MPNINLTTKSDLAQNPASENMTPKQAADFLNVPEATLAVWRSTNRVILPFFKLGHHVRYRRSDLEKFIDKSMRNAA